MKALILAGGRGSRLDELTKEKSKSLINLFEKRLIEYNLDHAVEAGVSEIIITVCYKQNEIIKTLGREYRGIKITYAKEGFKVNELHKTGIVDAIECAKPFIGSSDFILMLADEIVANADIRNMIKRFKREDLFAVCGTIHEEDRYSISKTYTAMVNEAKRAFRLIEKPRFKITSIKGTGHCVFKNDILDYIDRTPINAFRNQRELVDMIQVAIDDGKKVEVFEIAKDYVNVNTKEDYNLAKEMIKKNNPRILIVHNQMKHYGGAESLIVEMCNWLTKMGFKNDILTLSKSKKVEGDLINTEIIIAKNDIDLNPPGYKDMKDILKAIKVFRKKLKEIENNYDVINFHDFPVTWTLWPRRKPTVWFMNQPPNLWSKPNAGLFYRFANKFRIRLDKKIIHSGMDEICVLDPANKKRAYQRYNKNSRIVYCGINHEFFSKGNRNKAIKEWPQLKNKFVIMFSGQIAEGKKPLDAIKTIEKLKEKIPNVILILTGKEDPEYKKKLDDYIKERKLEKYVGYILMFGERERLRNLYKLADVGLFPMGKQGGWIAPFEMVCAGIPVVISSDMGSSFVAKENDLAVVTKDYSKAILDIYQNQKEYKKEVKKATIYIKNNLSWKQFTERMVWAFRSAWRRYK